MAYLIKQENSKQAHLNLKEQVDVSWHLVDEKKVFLMLLLKNLVGNLGQQLLSHPW